MRQPRSPQLATRTPARRAAPAVAAKRPVDIGEQRIYHITHLSNLPSILEHGALLADASDRWPSNPSVDISSPENRASRQETTVGGTGSAAVASFVPFFLSPNATVWEWMRAGVADPRIAASARELPPAEFVVLVSTVRGASQPDSGGSAFAVTDGDAAHVATRFGATADSFEQIIRRLLAEKDSEELLTAEFLVRDSLPFDHVTLVGVANDRARDNVKAILDTSKYHPRVAVYPPWFVRPE